MKSLRLKTNLLFALGAIGFTCSVATTASAQIVFDPSFAIAVGNQPDSSATGDLDGDTFIDIAATSDTPDKISLLFGAGDGTFTVPANIMTGAGTAPGHIAAVDVDGDSDLDLIVALKNINSVRVYQNNGLGGFTNLGTFAVGTEPRRFAVADLDGVNGPDLAVVNRGSGNMTVLFNNGSGSFGAPVTIPIGTDPRDVAAADLDDDTDTDLAVSEHDSRNIFTFINDGTGAFSAGPALSVGPNLRPEGVIAVDLNGDQVADVAAAASGNGLNVVSVFVNNGMGGFTGPTNFPVGAVDPGPIVASDFDCDGDRDVATANRGSNNVSVLSNNGTAMFGTALLVTVGTEPDHLAVGNFDGDGPDWVTANRGSGNISVGLNASDACIVFCGDASCDLGEDQCNCPQDCGAPPAMEVSQSTCQDGLDNDCDTLIDCADSDCAADPACAPVCGDATCDATEDQCNCPQDCGTPPTAEVPQSTCQDGLDNDCDTFVDCADADCATDPVCAGGGCTTDNQCDDGVSCTLDRCVDGACTNSAALFGDIAGSGGSCGPDGQVNIFDIFAVLDAFVGNSPCAP